MRNPPKLKRAYSVQGHDRGCVVFAANNLCARKEGASRLECTNADIESCVLAPEFDKYLPQGAVPRHALLEDHGWWQYCSLCESMVTNSTDGRVWDGDDIYCCGHCQAHEMNRSFNEAVEKAFREASEAEAVILAAKTFPGLSNPRAITDSKGKTLVFFDFPGCTSSAEWQSGYLNVRIGRNDTEAWEAYRATHQRASEVL